MAKDKKTPAKKTKAKAKAKAKPKGPYNPDACSKCGKPCKDCEDREAPHEGSRPPDRATDGPGPGYVGTENMGPQRQALGAPFGAY